MTELDADQPEPVLTPASFQARLLEWFDCHGRHDLPWQRERNPYRVWVSEIMLQQTQVTTARGYFERFMVRFPTLESLAEAPLDEVLHLWTGLGYYARARNLHRAAQAVQANHSGELPTDSVEALMALPGIGRSTAGAIIAQSTGKRAVILDGNVKRSLTRLHAVPGWPGAPAVERRLWRLAEHYTPDSRLPDYTQAMMDLGATLCRRGQPDCLRCPFNDVCLAYITGQTDRFPASKSRKALPTRRTQMLVLKAPDGRVWLEKRPPSGLWGGLWSLPEFDCPDSLDTWVADHVLAPQVCAARPSFTHTFSHFRLEITPWPVHGRDLKEVREQGVWVDPASPPALGLAAPVKQLLSVLAAENTPFALTSAPHAPNADDG